MRDWVQAGGALLLIADTLRQGAPLQSLLAFRVDMSKATQADPANFERVALDASGLVLAANKNLADLRLREVAIRASALTRTHVYRTISKRTGRKYAVG